MPTHTLEDDVYHIYDTAVSKTLARLMDRGPYCDTILLRGFNRKNKEHLFILRIALMLRDLTETEVEIECSWWDSVVINWNIHKGFHKVKRMKPGIPGGFWVPDLVEIIETEIKNEYDFIVNLGTVYNIYYEGSCG